MRRTVPRNAWVTPLILMLIAALVSGCGPGTGPADAPSRVVIAQGSDPTTFDPMEHRETTTSNVLLHIYDTVLERDDDMNIVPMLAEDYEYINDTTLRLYIRENVTFSNDEALTAETVKYNIDRVTGNLPGGEPTLRDFLFVNWAGAELVDEFTVDLLLNDPDPLTLSLLCDFQIVPMEYTQEHGFGILDTEPVGTGAYVLKEWVHEDRVVLTGRDDHWRGAPAISEVVFRPLPEAATRIAELQTGGIDIMVNLPPHNIPDLEAYADAEARTVPSARVVYGFFNITEHPELFGDPRVRQAMNHAIDVDALIEHIYDGMGLPVSTMAPPYFTGYDPSHPLYEYDPDRARQLLSEAGWDSSVEFEILTTRGRFLNDAELAEAVAGYLDAVGVRTRINAVEFGVFATATQQREIPEMFLAALGNVDFNVVRSMTYLVRSGTHAFSWYSNPEVDRLYDEAAVTTDMDRHEQLLQEALLLLFDDPPFIYLFALEDVYGVNANLNWQPLSNERIDMYRASWK